jgi:hypothetical protein
MNEPSHSEYEPGDLAEIRELPNKLGFVETEKLHGIKMKAKEVLKQYPDHINMHEKVVSYMTLYQLEGENIVENYRKIHNEDASARIGHEIDRIMLLMDADWNKEFILNEIDELTTFAEYESREEIINQLIDLKTKLKEENNE